MKLLNRRGYTIDQTVMIVAIIGILITLIVITIGWTLLHRTSGDKLASAATQLDDASMAFYSNNNSYPTTLEQLYDNGLVRFATEILGTQRLFYYHDNDQVNLQKVTLTPALMTYITGSAASADSLVYSFTNVPADQANEFDKTVDGTSGNPGRAILIQGGGDCTADNMLANMRHVADAAVTICYVGRGTR